MAYGRGWKPSRAKAQEWEQKLDEVQTFCDEHGISYSRTMDSFYFTLDGRRYRVSNHSVEASDRGAIKTDVLSGESVRVRDTYHGGREDDVTYIHASKTRVPEIYTALKAGKVLDGRGYEKF